MNDSILKTVIIVAPYFPPHTGGLERYAYEIAQRLHIDHKWKVVVITSGEQYGEDKKEEMNGLTIYRLAYRLRISNTPFSFRWFRKIRDILERENPNIINIHMPVPGIGDITTMIAGNKPIIITYHTNSMCKGKLLPDIFIKIYEYGPLVYLLRRANYIICSSDFVRFNFLNKYLNKSFTITPGVDTNIFIPAYEKKTIHPTILFVAGLGHAEQHKGLLFLIDAMQKIKESIPNIKLIIVGDGDMRSEYEKRVDKLGLREITTFKGRLNGRKLVEEYQKAHVFALPTSNDSFAMVVIEAVSCGLPVVTTTIGSIPSLVDDGVTGFLIPPKDSKILAEKIIKILKTPGYIKKFGDMAIEKTKRGFDWSVRAKQYDQIFIKIYRK